MYVGEGESIIRDIFKKARLMSPSFIFLDEVDTIGSTFFLILWYK